MRTRRHARLRLLPAFRLPGLFPHAPPACPPYVRTTCSLFCACCPLPHRSLEPRPARPPLRPTPHPFGTMRTSHMPTPTPQHTDSGFTCPAPRPRPLPPPHRAAAPRRAASHAGAVGVFVAVMTHRNAWHYGPPAAQFATDNVALPQQPCLTIDYRPVSDGSRLSHLITHAFNKTTPTQRPHSVKANARILRTREVCKTRIPVRRAPGACWAQLCCSSPLAIQGPACCTAV